MPAELTEAMEMNEGTDGGAVKLNAEPPAATTPEGARVVRSAMKRTPAETGASQQGGRTLPATEDDANRCLPAEAFRRPIGRSEHPARAAGRHMLVLVWSDGHSTLAKSP